jgi:hypothetical protein
MLSPGCISDHNSLYCEEKDQHEADYYMVNFMVNYYIYCLTYSRQVFKLPDDEKSLLVNDESSRMKVRGELQNLAGYYLYSN